MEYVIKGACKSVTGNVRTKNEDNYYFNFKTLKEENDGNNKTQTMQFENIDNVICSVFDGLGGEINGERASYIAASTLKEHMEENTNKEFIWEKYIDEANDKICEEMPVNLRMGTTVAAIQFLKDEISICNLGDSRIYGFKNKNLQQLSVDHTEARLQEKLNITLDHKPRLTQHLGIRREELKLTPYKNKYEYTQFNKILICSDGLTDMLEEKEIAQIMSQPLEVKEIVDQLVEKALEKGGKDNTTVIVLEIQKKKKTNYKLLSVAIILVIAIVAGIIIFISSNSFKITKNDYSGAVTVGQSYEFEYKGNVEIEFSNDNITYSNGKITAKKEGTTTITITNKKGKTLYKQTVKIFPN